VSADPSRPTQYRAGVGIVLINRQGLIFSGKRRDGRVPPWQMPQGGIKPGEAPVTALLREVEEELGIKKVSLVEFRPDWLAYDYPSPTISARAEQFRGQMHLWFLLSFEGEDRDIDIGRTQGEFSDWRWNPPARIIEEVASFKQPVYRQVMRFFAPTIALRAGATARAANKAALRRPRQRSITL
jgi:putative (di)nucleoside polyphosphate hydrolase